MPLKPYYGPHAGITIYHGDCREILPQLGAFPDVVITDPPYGDTSLGWDVRVSGWQEALTVVVALDGSMWVFGSLRYFFETSSDFKGWTLAQDVIWEKQNGSSFHADRFKRVHEHAVQFYRGEWSRVFKSPVMEPAIEAKRVIRASRPPHTGHIENSVYSRETGGDAFMRSVIRVPNCHGYAEHPTQKPVAIIDPLIRYSCRTGGVVLDPFMGSGSVLIAAKALGHFAIGIEIEEKYCEIAAKRLSQEVFQFEEKTQ